MKPNSHQYLKYETFFRFQAMKVANHNTKHKENYPVYENNFKKIDNPGKTNHFSNYTMTRIAKICPKDIIASFSSF